MGTWAKKKNGLAGGAVLHQLERSSAIEQIQLLSQAWELAEGSLSIGASA